MTVKIKNIIQTFLSLVFALVGLIAVFKTPFFGLVSLMLAAFLFPKTRAMAQEKLNYSLSRKAKIATTIALFLLFVIVMPKVALQHQHKVNRRR
jgi:hypothetical protein